MSLDAAKTKAKQSLKEFCTRYTYAVFSAEEQRNAALGLLDEAEVTAKKATLQAYRALYAEKKTAIEACESEAQLAALNWQAGFDTLEGGVNLTEQLRQKLLEAAGV